MQLPGSVLDPEILTFSVGFRSNVQVKMAARLRNITL